MSSLFGFFLKSCLPAICFLTCVLNMLKITIVYSVPVPKCLSKERPNAKSTESFLGFFPPP